MIEQQKHFPHNKPQTKYLHTYILKLPSTARLKDRNVGVEIYYIVDSLNFTHLSALYSFTLRVTLRQKRKSSSATVPDPYEQVGSSYSFLDAIGTY